MSRRLFAGAFAATLLAVATVGGPVRATETDSPGVEAITADFVDYLTFVGNAPLDADERKLVATQAAAELRARPDATRSGDATLRKLLAKVHAGEPAFCAKARELLRLQTAMLPQSDPARQLVERHDPTVVFDRTHRRLVTETTLAVLKRASVWVTEIAAAPAPDADFVGTQRAYLKAHYDSLTDSQQEAVAHIERDFPVAQELYQKANASQRAPFIKKIAATAHDRDQVAALTVTILAQSYEGVERQTVNDSIVLMGQMNNTMLFHAGYYH